MIGKYENNQENLIPCGPNFTLIGANSTLGNARLICFGEMHTDYSQKLNIATTINDMARDGDIILVEGFDSGEKVDKMSKPFLTIIKKGVHIYGWDQVDLRDYSVEIVHRLFKQRDKINKCLHSNDILSAIREDDVWKRMQAHWTAVALNRRNQYLKSTIEQMMLKFPGKRVFVIAGYLHTEEKDFQNFIKKFPYINLKGNIINEGESSRRYFNYSSGDGTSPEENVEKVRKLALRASDGKLIEVSSEYFIKGEGVSLEVGNKLYLTPYSKGVVELLYNTLEGRTIDTEKPFIVESDLGIISG